MFKTNRLAWNKRQLLIGLGVAVMAGAVALLTYGTNHAATWVLAPEAESGVVAGKAAAEQVQTASGSSYVRFGTDTGNSIFYGINNHLNQGGVYASPNEPGQLKDLGMGIVRHDVWDIQGANALKARLTSQYQPNGIELLPVITIPQSGNSETSNYNTGFTRGKEVATVLKGLVAAYEAGNEREIPLMTTGGSGIEPGHYDAAMWPGYRGLIRGLVDGIRSADPDTPVVFDTAGWGHYGAMIMLWNGRNPDNTTGAPTIRWDITGYHWYSDMGDIERANINGPINVLQILKDQFNKPIWITEFGFRPNGSATDAGNYTTTFLQQMSDGAQKYGIQSVQLYELYDDPPGGEGEYGVIRNDGATKKQNYQMLKTFIGANPR